MTQEKYLTSRELTEVLKMGRSTLQLLCKRGLPHIKIGKSRRFLLSEVTEFLRVKSLSQRFS
jgi:excisionase family DNA binding protein